MNNKELISELARRANMTQQTTQKMVAAVAEQLLSDIEANDSVHVAHFGTFEVKKRMERILVNPNTGKRMLVPPKLVLAFKPSTSLKERLQKGGAGDE